MSEILKMLPVWHEGETFIQQKVGVAERMAAVGQRVIRDFMPDQHRDFYAQLPFIVLGSVDSRGDAWATFLEAPQASCPRRRPPFSISRPEGMSPATRQAKACRTDSRSACSAWRCIRGAAIG